jgi:uncharacterized membrane protein HdeD (DUF308 family)
VRTGFKKKKRRIAMAPSAGNVFKQFLTFRGAASLFFGCAVLVWTLSDENSLALCFLFYSFVDGLLALIFSFLIKDRGQWIFRAEGVASLLVALFTLLGPVTFAGILAYTGSVLLPYFIIGRLLIIGIFQVLGIGFLKDARWRRAAALNGIISVAIGILLICLLPGMKPFTVALGVGSVLMGFCLIVMTFIFRSETGQGPALKESEEA